MLETVADIGEFGLIQRIRSLLHDEDVESPGISLGIGDDAAAFRPREGYELLITCDSLVEGRHYVPGHITPFGLGRRAMAVNVSDIAAMGGHPLCALVSLGLKAETQIAHIEAMYRGFLAELNPFGAAIIGGNITKTGNTDFIDITLVGEVETDKLVRRSTARVGDAILVTGYPGQAAAGLQMLLRSEHPSDDLHRHPLVRAFNQPTPRAREGQAVARSGRATAMIDTSDGFLGDLGHICQESAVGAVVYKEKLPISKALQQAARQLEHDIYDLVLQDSDDYELIITCDQEHVDRIRSGIAQVSDVPVTEVGRITEDVGEVRLMQFDGTCRRILPTGWNHFSIESAKRGTSP